MKKFAFTLAEVLITLVIIGVIAAITVPALMNKTDDTENLVAYKKALSVMNQALNTEYSLEGNTAGYTDKPISGLSGPASNWRGLPAIMAKRTNIIDFNIAPYDESDFTAFCERTRIFSTSDGIVYWINEPTNAYRVCPDDWEGCSFGMIDVNGKKGPNRRVSIRWDEKEKENVFVVDDRFLIQVHDRIVRPYGTYEAKVLQGDKYR